MPGSWGQKNAHDLPSVCRAGSATGPYKAVTVPSWPSLKPKPPTCHAPTSVKVTFQAITPTRVGENIFIAGSIPQLGSWDLKKALPLSADMYDNTCPLWQAQLDLPAGTKLEYKFVRKYDDGRVVWEDDDNRSTIIPKKCGVSSIILKGSWR